MSDDLRPRINTQAYGRRHPERVVVIYDRLARRWCVYRGAKHLRCLATHAVAIWFAQERARADEILRNARRTAVRAARAHALRTLGAPRHIADDTALACDVLDEDQWRVTLRTFAQVASPEFWAKCEPQNGSGDPASRHTFPEPMEAP